MNITLPDLSLASALAIGGGLVSATWGWAEIATRLEQQDRSIASLERALDRERTDRIAEMKEWDERLRKLERDTLKRMIWNTRPARATQAAD